MANIIKRVWRQNKFVQIDDLKGMLFQAEQAGHTFEISGIDEDGNTVVLTGTPSGVLLRPDNTDVALTCSVSGGVVSATLPAECYDVPGRFGLTIFITSDNSKVAIYAAIGTISRTSSGTASPGTTQSVVDLINAINAAFNSIPASYSDLLADIAPTYSDSALYAVGQYAWYDGDLKRCIVPITTSESYTAAHWTSAVLGQDVSDLKSAFSIYDEGVKVAFANHSSWYRGYLTSAGVFTQSNQYATPTDEPFELAKGNSITIIPNGLNCTFCEYSYSGGEYSRTDAHSVTTETTFSYNDDQYVGFYLSKPSGANLGLDEITTVVYVTTNTQKQINALSEKMTGVETNITGLQSDVDDLENLNIEQQFEMYNDLLFDDKTLVTLPYYDEEKYGRIPSYTNPVYTGTYNIADLFGFPDSRINSDKNITVNITKNHVTVSGTPSANVYVSLNTGNIYTDGSVMRAEGQKYVLPTMDVFLKAFYSKSTGNNSVYVQSLISGNIVSVSSGSSESSKISTSANWGQLYLYLPSGSAVDIDVCVGLFTDYRDSSYRVEHNTSVEKITSESIFSLGELTWGTSGQQIMIVKNNIDSFGFESEGRKIVWLGDSISQLQLLPHRVGQNMGSIVYDCSFAGAPMTYGNPRYEGLTVKSLSEQIESGSYTQLDTALDNQEADGIDVAEKRINAATLKSLDFATDVTDIVIMAGTNDLNNDYVTTGESLTAFSEAVAGIITTLNTAYPSIRLYFISNPYRGDITPSSPDKHGHSLIDIIEKIQEECEAKNIPFDDLYHTSGINNITMSVFLMNDHLHQTTAGDILLADKCAKWLLTH